MKYKKSSNIIKGNSKIQAGETNDCSVRAYATALDVTYDAAHEFVKDTYDRIDRKGCNKMVGITSKLEGKDLEVENTKFNINNILFFFLSNTFVKNKLTINNICIDNK